MILTSVEYLIRMNNKCHICEKYFQKKIIVIILITFFSICFRGNSLDSSPVNSPQFSKNKVRKSFEGLIRRLSGGKDSQVIQTTILLEIFQHSWM